MCTFCDQGCIFKIMKFILIVFITTFFMASNHAVAESIMQKLKIKPWYKEPSTITGTSTNKEITSQSCEKKTGFTQKYKIKPWYKEPSPMDDEKCLSNIKQVKRNTNSSKSFSYKDKNPQNISFYTGTFDTIDKEGDDKTNLVGLQHKNEDLFRDTWIGRFSPTTGAFVTGKSSIYLYTGVEAKYNLGPINFSPSFAPGYYEAGDGKDLGSALEFKSEIKIGVDLFKNSNLGYSYSHISNNDWGDRNPGTDNQSITFSKNF